LPPPPKPKGKPTNVKKRIFTLYRTAAFFVLHDFSSSDTVFAQYKKDNTIFPDRNGIFNLLHILDFAIFEGESGKYCPKLMLNG
jgi:hypothetical protein